MYTHSMEQTRGHVQRLQEEINTKDDEHHEEKEQLQREHEECLQEERRKRAELQEQLQRQQLLVRNLQEEVDTLRQPKRKDDNYLHFRRSGKLLTCTIPVQGQIQGRDPPPPPPPPLEIIYTLGIVV